MCQSVSNRRARAAVAALIGRRSSTVDSEGSKGTTTRRASQPSAAQDKKPSFPSSSSSSSSSSSLASANNSKPKTLTGDPTERRPTAVPPFTIGTLRKAIPPRCFERSLPRSALSLVLDLALSAALAAAAAAGIPRIRAPSSCPLLRGITWLAYWWLQGAVCTGIWVQAHECGHQAFSRLVSFTAALTGRRERRCRPRPSLAAAGTRSSFPVRRAKSGDDGGKEGDGSGGGGGDSTRALREQLLASAPGRFGAIAFALTLGWPAYLLFNASGRPTFPEGSWPNHFSPSSPIFTSKREKIEVAISDAALAAVAVGLFFLGKSFSFDNLFYFYFVPYLVVNAWLVTITLLQHTHPALPHYYTDSWDWLRGALSTVDRDYGWFLNTVHHHIADTHVLHHLFSQIPHYHAQEATESIKPILGPYYAKDDGRGILKSIWEDFRECAVVAADAREEREEGKRAPLWFRRLVE